MQETVTAVQDMNEHESTKSSTDFHSNTYIFVVSDIKIW